MIKIRLSDNRVYDFRSLQAYVGGRCGDMLEDLSKGHVPAWIPGSVVRDPCFGQIPKNLSETTLDKKEIRWFAALEELREKLSSFDRRGYEVASGDDKNKLALRLGRECALLAEKLMEGYVVRKGWVSTITNPYRTFINNTRTIIVKDPGSSIGYPLGLRVINGRVLIIEDDAELVDHLREVIRSRFTYRVKAVPFRMGVAAERIFQPGLIISSMKYPTDIGASLCSRLRHVSRAKMIIMDSREEACGPAFKAGATVFLHRPFAAETLIEVVRRYIEIRQEGNPFLI